jgi:hypothetical protein
VVNAHHLRTLLLGRHPGTDAELLGAYRERKVAAFDVTFSAPIPTGLAAATFVHAPAVRAIRSSIPTRWS